MDIVNLMQTLNACHGPSGDEREVAQSIQALARPFADEITTDALGNLICHKTGRGPKLMFAAHMDSVGLMVTHIETDGYLRFGAIGGLSVYDLPGTPVRFQNGTRGVIAVQGKAPAKNLKLEHLYIDIGASHSTDAEQRVRVGDTAVFDTSAFVTGRKLCAPYLDNRIACCMALNAMERIEHHANDLYFVFTVQEEVGLRGAQTAAYGIEPDYGMVIDVTESDDIPDAPHECSSVSGKGAAIKVMDHSVICHPTVVNRLKSLAVQHKLPFQMDVLRSGGTDAGVIQRSRSGVYTGGISVACRYIHTALEMVDLDDVEACTALLAAFAQEKLE